MARFAGYVGFAEEAVEVSPGVWDDQIVERLYRGDIIRDSRRLEVGSKVNDDLIINTVVSVVGDQYAYDHYYAIRFVNLNGVKWKVAFAEVVAPRILLTLGKVYNG